MQVLYHGNCPDGFGAALSSWLKFGDSAIYSPVNHNDKIPEINSDNLLMLDFCYPLEIMEELAKKVKKLIIIDHHKGVQDILKKISYLNNVEVIYDENHSASSLTWSYFNEGIEVPKLLQFIEDRDCHFNKLEDSKVALMWLDTHPHVFQLWKTFLGFGDDVWGKIVNNNTPMIKKFNSMIKRAATHSIETTLAGYPAAVSFGSDETASDIALHLSEMVKGIGIVFVLQPNGNIKGSLRTKEDIDLIPIAQKLGGNGHSFAAAFPCSPEKLAFALAKQDLFSHTDYKPKMM